MSLGGGAPLPDNDLCARAVAAHAEAIARLATDRQFATDSTLLERFGERGRAKCTEDALRHLSYVGSSASTGSDALFADYVGWAKILLARLGLGADDLTRNLIAVRDATREVLPPEHGSEAARIIDVGLARLPTAPETPPSFLAGDQPHAELARQYLALLLAGDRRDASNLVLDAVRAGVGIRDVYLHVFQRSQYEIGRLWQMNEISVAEEHFCTAATQLIMSQLYPQIFATTRKNRRLVAACVGGDLHEIGVRMVADFFELDGWDTFYLGANTPLAGIVLTAQTNRADVVALSATMSFHVPTLAEVVTALKAVMPRPPKILVGGYPFRVETELWRRVGAHGYAADALGAVAEAHRLLE